VYLDCTYGRGGHSAAILARLGAGGRLVAIDRDPDAVAAAGRWRERVGDGRFSIGHARFSQLGDVLDAHGIAAIDGVLFDLGVSSPQLDDPARGFSFRDDGPLDMRMDPTHGMSASQWLNNASEGEIAEVVRDYGEERFAVPIAKAIVARRRDADGAALQTTGELARLVAGTVRRRQKRPEVGKDPATRTFQALRIFVNQELEELPAGEDGLILIGGTQVMEGYLNDKEKTKEVIWEQDGIRWYKTGDKGRLDQDGFLAIVDRFSRFAKIHKSNCDVSRRDTS